MLWYASRNRVAGNRIERGRYGAHLMYSHGNEIVGNRFVGNVTGLFVMYSRDVEIRGNVFADSAGRGGHRPRAQGVRQPARRPTTSFVHNTIGLYVDTSPLWPDDRNRFERQRLPAERRRGLRSSAAPPATSFAATASATTRCRSRWTAAATPAQAVWRGNEFDDYAGYDLDGDGTGDLPYELRSLASDLVGRGARRSRSSAARRRSRLAEAIGRIVPLFEPRLVLVDPDAAHDAGRRGRARVRIEVRGVSKRFGRVTALDGVELRAGAAQPGRAGRARTARASRR